MVHHTPGLELSLTFCSRTSHLTCLSMRSRRGGAPSAPAAQPHEAVALVRRARGRPESQCDHGAAAPPQRQRRSLMRLWRLYDARVDGLIFVAPLPFTSRPRALRPAAVKPRSSRCFITGLQIQLILGSSRITLWYGSTMTTSNHLCTASCATQYELRTRNPPHLRPTRSSAMLRRFLVALFLLMPWWHGFP